MTTDPTAPDDRAARLAALRERRAATGPATPPPDGQSATAPALTARPRARRRHAATGGRIMAGSLSAAAALALMGAMAHATTSTAQAPAGPAAATSATPTVIVIRRSGDTASAVAAPVTPRVTPTAAAPVTTSRGS
jgi:hypothetical protein